MTLPNCVLHHYHGVSRCCFDASIVLPTLHTLLPSLDLKVWHTSSLWSAIHSVPDEKKHLAERKHFYDEKQDDNKPLT